jgi:hypothetical protein
LPIATARAAESALLSSPPQAAHLIPVSVSVSVSAPGERSCR